jgi:gliding motility-associated-like protein
MGNTCADYFEWTGTMDMDNPASLTPVITPTESRTYLINFVMMGKTCRDSISIFVLDPEQLQCENLLLPNSFSPNNDGINDRFGISNSFIIEEMKSFEIFNRLGTRVFQTKEKNDSWDGLYKGNRVNPDKYVYRVSYTCGGEDYNVQGVLNLLR